ALCGGGEARQHNTLDDLIRVHSKRSRAFCSFDLCLCPCPYPRSSLPGALCGGGEARQHSGRPEAAQAVEGTEREHCVVEAKPDNTVDDLRLHKPWKELKEFANGFDLGMEDAMLHSHIPYAVILLQAAQQWQHGEGRGEAGEAGAGAGGGEAAPVAMQADGEGQGGA
ncbi:unnamed protein product, partial [Closterium sp. NIES-54]